MADERAAATALLEAGNFAEARVRFERVTETLRTNETAIWLLELADLLASSGGRPTPAELAALADKVGSEGAAAALRAPFGTPSSLVAGVLDGLRCEGLWR